MKKLSSVTLFILAIAFMSLPATTTLAKGKPKKTTPIPVDTNDKISAVHLTAITVSVYATHSSKEYKVTPATKITVNGKPGTLSGLATGMNVTVSTGTDPTAATAIDAKSPGKK
jgi:hypothetical protein